MDFELDHRLTDIEVSIRGLKQEAETNKLKQNLILTALGLMMQNQVILLKDSDRLGAFAQAHKTEEMIEYIAKVTEPEKKQKLQREEF